MSRGYSGNSRVAALIGLLATMFVILKLIDFDGNRIYDWPWVWVLSPVWISATLLIGAVVVVWIVLALKGLRGR